MYQRTYFPITSSELVKLSLAQFDYMAWIKVNSPNPQKFG